MNHGAYAPLPAFLVSPPPPPVCHACHVMLVEPLILCGCGCRLPLHPSCHVLMTKNQSTCPVCRKFWIPSTQSVTSTAFTEIQDLPLSHTECVPSCDVCWIFYTVACLSVIVGGMVVFFWYVV